MAYSPHKTAEISLSEPAKRIASASSSVFFAVMGLGGGGPVLDALKKLPSRRNIFSYGVRRIIG